MERNRPGLLRWLLILGPAVAFVALLAFGLLRSAPGMVRPGSRLPDVSLPLLDGTGTITTADLGGRPVVINFWASWCGPCRDEAGVLERAWRRYRSAGVLILGINIRDSADDARAFVREFDITYPVVRDEGEVLARRLGVFGMPETFFVDHRTTLLSVVSGDRQGERSGTVILGAIDEERLASGIEVLLRREAGAPDGG